MFNFSSKKAGRRQEGKSGPAPRPRLERRNATKNIACKALWEPTAIDESPALLTRSLDLSPADYSDQTSFRIRGSFEGEVDLLYRSLGLSGPEDFAIPAAAWEESLRARSSSDIVLRCRFFNSPSPSPPPEDLPASSDRPAEVDAEFRRAEVRDGVDETVKISRSSSCGNGGGDGGIRGIRPPVLTTLPAPISVLSLPPGRLVLAPPPFMNLPVVDRTCSTWDIVKSFAPVDDSDDPENGKNVDPEVEEENVCVGDKDVQEAVEERVLIFGETSEDCTGSFSTCNDDDSSSTTTESICVISPNATFKRNMGSWMRGQLLGSGSFGKVYEGISVDGQFFAIKEVSLLDKGSNAHQCILQLEQEVALLSQFEHENIVQYYGTDKEDSKLFIFLELVTQGSLASLYQKYQLRDTQVSAYTRQILNGLNYLHERNVVHRDIKCANILVHVNGSVKLADFGLAKEMSNITDLKSCKGSVYWMAPEVVHPKKTYGRAADIWSLGCTVLEMLTRQIPYPNMEWQRAFFMIGRGDQPPIPCHLSKEAQDFIQQCVQVDPNSRPTAAQLLEHPFLRRPLSTR